MVFCYAVRSLFVIYEGLLMSFTRAKLVLACSLSLSFALSACSNSNNEDKQTTFTASTPATGEASNIIERNAEQRLVKTLEQHFKTANIQAKVNEIKATEVPNLVWVSLEGMGSVYATHDGKYIIQGDVIRLGDKTLHNLSESLQAENNKKILSNLKLQDLIVYPAQGKTKHIVYVFTDISCPYCHKLHEQMPAINAKGIEVRYIAWPRGDQFMPAMQSVWCSDDRKAAFNRAISGEQLAAASCSNPVQQQYEMGLAMGVNGTPAIYNSEGMYLGGYLSADELAARLDK